MLVNINNADKALEKIFKDEKKELTSKIFYSESKYHDLKKTYNTLYRRYLIKLYKEIRKQKNISDELVKKLKLIQYAS